MEENKSFIKFKINGQELEIKCDEKYEVKDENKESEIGRILNKVKNLILESKHYSGKIETIDFIKDKLTGEQFEGYLVGNVIKYLSRYNKNDKSHEDLIKGFTYYFWLMQDKREDEDEQAM